MVPLPRYSTVAGIPVLELLPPKKILDIIERTRKGGTEIVDLLNTSSYYAASSSVADMVEAIVQNKKRIVPAAAHLNGQYGIKDVFVGVPVKLGMGGVEEIIQLQLAPEELDALKKSAELVRENVSKLKELVPSS